MSTTTENPALPTVTDARGRVFGLKRPNLLAQMRLVEILGDTSSNTVFMNMTLPILYISTIDGEPEPRPSSRRELDNLIQRLDDDGLTAVAKGIAEHFAPPTADQAEASLKN